MESQQKIYPTAEELSTVNTVRCPEDGCSSIFMSESNLNLHLAKTHKKEHLMMAPSNLLREYYCPDQSCTYNDSKSFKSLKLLKQHYLKVHSEKSFGCDTCDTKFSTQSAKNRHIEYCNAKFTCCDCTSSYSSYESLMTHGRRKQHAILDKIAYRTQIKPITKSNSITNLSQKNKKNVLVLPKGSASLQFFNVTVPNLATLEKGSQTDIWTEKPRLSKKSPKLVNNTQETQTFENKQRLTAETQTIGDYISKKPSVEKIEDDDRKSIKTQTKPVDSTTKSCNTSFNLNDFNFITENAATQTTNVIPHELLYSTTQGSSDLNEFELMHSSSQTSFNQDMDTFDSENYFNCNSETQTDFMSMLNTDYSSNMYTQTCDNLLLTDLAFINSHTQTVFDDVLKSVESQTTMSSHSAKLILSCHDMAHMETQTDVEFKQMLEEINA